MYEVIGERFNSIHEFTNAVMSRTKISGVSEQGIIGGSFFTLTENIEEARELLECGWDERVEEMKTGIKLKVKEAENATRVTFVNNVVGSAPSVGRALSGHPRSMRQTKREPVADRAVSIVYDTAAMGTVGVNEMVKAGITVLSAIELLERHGYTTRLDFTANSIPQRAYGGDSGYIASLCIRLKDFGAPLNLKKVAFPLAHPSMFRRFAFLWRERNADLDGKLFGSGGGCRSCYERAAAVEHLRKVEFAGQHYINYADARDCYGDPLKLIAKLGIELAK